MQKIYKVDVIGVMDTKEIYFKFFWHIYAD